MPLRLLLILTICLQQLSFAAVAATTPGRGGCQDSTCCQVIEYTTCCGERVTEMRCGRTGESTCRCGVQPADPTPEPPAAPAPVSGKQVDLGVSLPATSGSIADLSQATPSLGQWHGPFAGRTHNDVRALLCIWRT